MTTPDKKPEGGQPGNRNATKPPEEILDARTYVYSTKDERNKWVSEAQKTKGRSLSEWLRDLANRATSGFGEPPKE